MVVCLCVSHNCTVSKWVSWSSCNLCQTVSCETWYLHNDDYHSLSVHWNNAFHRIFHSCWCDSVSPVLFSCNTLTMSYMTGSTINLFRKKTWNIICVCILLQKNVSETKLSAFRPSICFVFKCVPILCLQYFDTVGWHEGHPACKKLSGGMLAWLYVWVNMQTYKWPSWCHCHSLSLAPVNPDWFYLPGFTFLVPAHPHSPRQYPRGP